MIHFLRKGKRAPDAQGTHDLPAIHFHCETENLHLFFSNQPFIISWICTGKKKLIPGLEVYREENRFGSMAQAP